MDYIKETRETGVCGAYDVIVVGGGVAGAAAALAAARNNSTVLLIEKTTVLGGLATAGLVIVYLPLCDGRGHKVISGISEELLYVSIQYGYDNLPEIWRGGPWSVETKERYRTVFNAPAFVMALDELMREAKVDVLLDTVFCDVEMKDGCCQAVIVENKSGRQAYRCKAVVDASGDADVLYQAGAECVEQTNHLTYWAYYQSDSDKRAFPLGGAGSKYIKVMAIGNYNGSDISPELPRFKGTDARAVTEFLVRSRGMALERMREDPGLSFSSFPSQAQFRTTRRIKGEHTLRTEDAGRHFHDSIGCTGIWNIPEPVYEIPFGTLISKQVKNVFASGRIISSANGHGWEITRPIPACALTGQAAGSAAAIYASGGAEVSISQLQAMLKKDGVLLNMGEDLVSQSERWLEAWRKNEDPWVKDIPDEQALVVRRGTI
ncbi:MAG: FAD-dependent oxidoreductase [Clostridiales bacterium]|nr:FAD-dependent oxidoreductase [Clostridiales bacterium]